MADARVLIVDDERDVGEFIATVVDMCGMEPIVAEDHTRFEDDYRRTRPDVVVTDLQMPGLDGVEVLRFLALDASRCKIILLSGFDPRVIASARRLGDSLGLDVLGTLEKPVSVGALQAMLRRAVSDARGVSEEELRAGIDDRQFVLHYQPKLGLAGEHAGTVVGVEALARWQHPTRGLLQPGAFIPLAESTGAIVPLTDALADEAIAQMGRWREHGLDLSVSINVAPQALDTLALPDQLARRIREADCDPTRLVLEITETGAMNESSNLMDVLTRLRLKGFGLSIDDFGTGYSSLVQLYRMPFSELKVDKSFVMELEQSEEAQVIVRALTDLAHNLALSVCAEGVENEFAWTFLEQLGCDRAQGFHMSRPLPPESLPGWIEDWHEARFGRDPSGSGSPR